MPARLYRKPGSLVWWWATTDDRGTYTERSTGHVNFETAAASADDADAPKAAQAGVSSDETDPPAPAVSQKAGVLSKVSSSLASTCAHAGAYDLTQALGDFLSFGELDRTAATIGCYEVKGGHLVRLMGGQDLELLHVDEIHAYCKLRLSEGAARESIRKELCVLRQTLQLARDRGLFQRDPAAVIPRFRAKYVPRRRFLTEEEFEQLLTHLSPARQLWVMFAVCSGGRLSELEEVKWGDIDWRGRRIHVRGTKTKNSDRFVPLHVPLAEALAPLRGTDDAPVVGTWHNARRDLARACAAAKIERVSPNDLRRTFASWLKQAECDSFSVAKLLGHTSSRMVELVYGHLNQRALEEAVGRLPIKTSSSIARPRHVVFRSSHRKREHLH